MIAPQQQLSGPTDVASSLLVAAGLLGGAAFIGWLLWPKEQYTPNYDMRWADHRQRLRESKAREKEASQIRERKLDLIRQQCAAQQQQIKDQCRVERQRVRAEARSVKAREKARREDAWAQYRWRKEYGSGARKARKTPKMTKAESDSLAEHNVKPELIPLWRRHRKRFSYDLPPDERVELFMEFLHESPEIESVWLDEAMPTDTELARAEREHYAEQQLEEPEEVPF